jgi:hypothetical protein
VLDDDETEKAARGQRTNSEATSHGAKADPGDQ